MYKNKKILAVITARGESKGLPKKNIKLLLHKPLIAWTIEAARGSKYIDKTIVSTDDQNIAKVSRRYGTEIPFLRPKILSRDSSSSVDVLIHAIKFFKDKGVNFDIYVLLQPTSPLRRGADIDNAIKILFKKNAKTVISVTEALFPPLWTNILPCDGSMKNFLSPEIANKNRQSLQKFFQPNGAVFTGFIDYLLEKKTFYGDKAFAYIMPKVRSVDIDDIIDFKLAELLLKSSRE